MGHASRVCRELLRGVQGVENGEGSSVNCMSLPYEGLKASKDLWGNVLRMSLRMMRSPSWGEGSGIVEEVGREGDMFHEGMQGVVLTGSEGGTMDCESGLGGGIKEDEGNGSQGGNTDSGFFRGGG